MDQTNTAASATSIGEDGFEMRSLERMTATILSSRRATDPYGLAGGLPGKHGENRVDRASGSCWNH